MIYEAAFIGLGLIADMILTTLFPFDFALNHSVFIPCTGFCLSLIHISALSGIVYPRAGTIFGKSFICKVKMLGETRSKARECHASLN